MIMVLISRTYANLNFFPDEFCPDSYFGILVVNKGGGFHISFLDMLVRSH